MILQCLYLAIVGGIPLFLFGVTWRDYLLLFLLLYLHFAAVTKFTIFIICHIYVSSATFTLANNNSFFEYVLHVYTQHINDQVVLIVVSLSQCFVHFTHDLLNQSPQVILILVLNFAKDLVSKFEINCIRSRCEYMMHLRKKRFCV